MIARNYVLGFLCACVFLMGSCEEKSIYTHPLQGKWTRDSYMESIAFDSTGYYAMSIRAEGSDPFYGRCVIAGNRVTFIDMWCGWKLPGQYEFSVSDDGKELTFQAVNDNRCDRNQYFPGTWKREADDVSFDVDVLSNLPIEISNPDENYSYDDELKATLEKIDSLKS